MGQGNRTPRISGNAIVPRAGKHVIKRSLINAEFIEGGTIGPAPGR